MHIPSAKELSLIISQRRKKLKLSQAEVGRLVGLKQQTISEFENNPEGTKLSTLFHILSAVQLDIKILPKDNVTASTAEWKEEW